ncbi:AraC family transcriptional regulator [Wenjunlia vitaminophila]|uniref:AraC family transcriptional regulator n=1 Tax=Wenjunlia vitaminophila TaxID=76728 RepID=A0A0T6LWW8_WENVI|nr:GlxA family transcriptional regulator [Wenjunlia vitaminophila]KRV50557.1 AraC family transcriptional regulator [Wenjunlia vitaminophila]
MSTRSVLIVLFDGVQSLDVTGPLEVFAGASQYTEARGAGRSYTVRTASPGGTPVRCSSGLRLSPDADLERCSAPHTLIVPGGDGALRHENERVVAWLRGKAPRAARTASVCTGAFLLAEAGLLAGRRATTHWALADTLASRYPEVTVDPAPVFVRDGAVFTSAGVTTGIDLALELVEQDLGRHAALTIARHLVVFLRRPGNQRQFSSHLEAQTAHREPLREVQRWIAEHPADDLSVAALARRAALSPRQFARAFAAEVGVPPGRYVDRVRLEAARRLLEDTRDGIEEVAKACGYRTTEAMRRAFHRELAVSPAEYRRRFSPAASSPATP